MLIDPMYFAVFFDVDKPKNDHFAMKKRINYFKYVNITDGIVFNKEVVLDGVKHRIISHSTFSIINSVDNYHIVICDVERIK